MGLIRRLQIKSFANTKPHKMFFSSSLANGPYKLECLSLAGLSGLHYVCMLERLPETNTPAYLAIRNLQRKKFVNKDPGVNVIKLFCIKFTHSFIIVNNIVNLQKSVSKFTVYEIYSSGLYYKHIMIIN
jgi:hypothetical protein